MVVSCVFKKLQEDEDEDTKKQLEELSEAEKAEQEMEKEVANDPVLALGIFLHFSNSFIMTTEIDKGFLISEGQTAFF